MATQPEPMSAPRHPYPAARGGGLFLVIVGTGIAAGGLLGKQLMFPVFFTGFAAGFIALALFRRPLSRPLGTLTRVQRLSLPVAIVLEIVLIAIVLRLFQDELAHGQARQFTFSILFVVGIHFVVFAISSGPLMLLLAALCCSNAMFGLLVPTVPIAPLWILDGLIKIGVGIAMFRTRIPDRPPPTAVPN